MAYLDFKVTRWERLAIPEDKIEEVIKRLKESCCDEVYDIQDIEGVYIVSTSPDESSEEPMTPYDNGGNATQELYNEKGEIIYINI